MCKNFIFEVLKYQITWHAYATLHSYLRMFDLKENIGPILIVIITIVKSVDNPALSFVSLVNSVFFDRVIVLGML